MKVAILVPWRTDDGAREKVWRVCRRRWEALFPDWPVFEGASPEGPFNRSAAINDAKRQAGPRDVYLAIDADVMLKPQNVRAAVERAYKTGKVTWAHRRWRGITQEATERLTRPDPVYAEGALGKGGIERSDFSDADLDLIIEKTNPFSWSCCIAIRADAWETLGGFDERFAGWGHEDGAFASAAAGLVGADRVFMDVDDPCTSKCRRPPEQCGRHAADVLNFDHPRVPGSGRADKSGSSFTAQALVNARLGMRYAVALRRDYGLTDRPERSGEEELTRDIQNYLRMDEGWAKDQPPAERAKWDGWWPSLEELRAGAQDMTFGIPGPPPTAMIIMHTGGPPENWLARREYLARSLASIAENVSGPIVQSVVYDCWGDDAIRAEIAEMVPAGWYVVGPSSEDIAQWRATTAQPDMKWYEFNMGMQSMWKYIGRRSKGEYVFQVEDDFTYDRPVDLGEMMAVLAREPHIAQMALLRDACYPDEIDLAAIGNILGWPRPAFTFRDGWFEHRQFFTLNPSLFRKNLTERDWPRGHHSETLFGKALYRDGRVRSAFWGDGASWITHIGKVRAGVGY